MNPRLKNLLKYSIFIGLAVFLVYLAFRNSDPAKLWADILQANYWLVFTGAFLGYTALISRGYRWLILLEPMGYKPKAWNCVNSVSVLYLVNMAVPRAGEVARCTSLNQVEDIPVDKLFGTVILERVVDFIMLISIMIFTFFMYMDELIQFFALAFGNTEMGSPSDNTKFILLGIAGVFGVLFLVFRKRIINHPKFEVVRNFWQGMKEGLKTIKTMRRKKAFILHTLYIWSTYFLMVYVVFYAIPATSHLAWHDAFFVFVAASLGIVVPTPGGIGAYHYLVMLALSILGLSETDGLAYATIVHSSQTLMLLIAGAFGFLFLYLERRKKDLNAASTSPRG